MQKARLAVVVVFAVMLLPIFTGVGLVRLTRHQPLHIGRMWYSAGLLPPSQWEFSYCQVGLGCGVSSRMGCVGGVGRPNNDGGICN